MKTLQDMIEYIEKMDLGEIQAAMENRRIAKGNANDILDQFEGFLGNVEGFLAYSQGYSVPRNEEFSKKVRLLSDFYQRTKYITIFANIRVLIYALHAMKVSAEVESTLTSVKEAIDRRITPKNINAFGTEGAIAGIFNLEDHLISANKIFNATMNSLYSDMLEIIEDVSFSLENDIDVLVQAYNDCEKDLYPLVEEFLTPLRQYFYEVLIAQGAEDKDYFDKLIHAYMTMLFNKLYVEFLADKRIRKRSDFNELNNILSSTASTMEITREQDFDPVDILHKLNSANITVTDDDELNPISKSHADTVSAPVNANQSNSSFFASSVSAPVAATRVRAKDLGKVQRQSVGQRSDSSPKKESISSRLSSFFSRSSRDSILPNLASSFGYSPNPDASDSKNPHSASPNQLNKNRDSITKKR